MGGFPIDRGREVRMEKDIKIGKKAVLRVFYGVLEVGREGVDVGEEGLGVVVIPGSSYGIVNKVVPGHFF